MTDQPQWHLQHGQPHIKKVRMWPVNQDSDRTVRRYQKLLRGQSILDAFGFKQVPARIGTSPMLDRPHKEPQISPIGKKVLRGPSELDPSDSEPEIVEMEHACHPGPSHAPNELRSQTLERNRPMIQVREESMTPPPLSFDNEIPMVQVREESMTPPPLSFDDETQTVPSPNIPGTQESELTSRQRPHTKRPRDDSDTDHSVESEPPEKQIEDEEPWEEEIHETLAARVEVRNWNELRDQIKKDLGKKHCSLPLSQINQLMILRNFATLRLKGFGRMAASQEIARQWHEKLDGTSDHFACRIRALARHYQVFEQLPPEHRGGIKNAKSLLKDEAVKAAALSWLTEQKVHQENPKMAIVPRLDTVTYIDSIDTSPVYVCLHRHM
ncbi:hypothetical protein BD779DRAFT_1673582 [Infundibulicybe gibba]|nr:hypothetical protein BD779DRAFT_1673582 [Infundibulicybe gibba]